MVLDLTQENEVLRQSVREFAENEMPQYVMKMQKNGDSENIR
jgi:hypothetical protein